MLYRFVLILCLNGIDTNLPITYEQSYPIGSRWDWTQGNLLTNLKRQCRAFKIVLFFFLLDGVQNCRVRISSWCKQFFLHEEAMRCKEILITSIIKPCADDDLQCVSRWPKSFSNHYIPTVWTRCENTMKSVCLGRGEDDINHIKIMQVHHIHPNWTSFQLTTLQLSYLLTMSRSFAKFSRCYSCIFSFEICHFSWSWEF